MYKKKLPEHIVPKFDESLLQWGIWNKRLHQWVGKDEHFGHAVWGSEAEALAGYLEHF